MNNDLFQQARAAYARKDFQGALAAYTQCLQDAGSSLAPGEVGLLYHQIGNCLVKLKSPNEAIHAYTQATADAAYDACGAVNYNLGMITRTPSSTSRSPCPTPSTMRPTRPTRAWATRC